MPAVGVGQMSKYPAASATQTILKTINEFFKEQQNKGHQIHIREIHLVDVSDAIVNHFY